MTERDIRAAVANGFTGVDGTRYRLNLETGDWEFRDDREPTLNAADIDLEGEIVFNDAMVPPKMDYRPITANKKPLPGEPKKAAPVFGDRQYITNEAEETGLPIPPRIVNAPMV